VGGCTELVAFVEKKQVIFIEMVYLL